MLRDTIMDMAARVDQLEDLSDADAVARGQREAEVDHWPSYAAVDPRVR